MRYSVHTFCLKHTQPTPHIKQTRLLHALRLWQGCCKFEKKTISQWADRPIARLWQGCSKVVTSSSQPCSLVVTLWEAYAQKRYTYYIYLINETLTSYFQISIHFVVLNWLVSVFASSSNEYSYSSLALTYVACQVLVKHNRHALIAGLYSFVLFKIYRGLPLHLITSTRHNPPSSSMFIWSKGKGAWVGSPVYHAGCHGFYSWYTMWRQPQYNLVTRWLL